MAPKGDGRTMSFVQSSAPPGQDPHELIQQYEALHRQDKTLNVHEPVQQVLDINFRSHAGILDVGNALVAVLREVSPLTIDRLPREHAFFKGPKPLLLGAMTAQDVALLTAGRQGRKRQIEFGANQCILLRSTAEEDVSAVLPDSIRRSNALIMEVLQSKGLEFEDVLICDFLSSLANDAREWRVLLSYLQQLERHPAVLAELRQAVLQGHGEGSSFMDAMQRGGRHHQRRLLEDVPLTEEEKKALLPAEFDPALHARLVEELKRLYVAVTRARNNLVIFESNPIARAALYYYLRRLGLAMEVKTNLLYAQDSLLSNRASSNTPADWAERGISLMQQQATHCFTQAQDHLRLSYCKARQLLEDSAVTDKSEAAVLLVEAAAGAAARQEDSKLKAAGSSSSLPAITLAGFSEWLELSAGLYNKVLGRPAEAIALYCQVEKYSEAEKLCRALSEAADRLQQHDVQAALGLVTEGLSRAAASTAALQRSAAAASTSSPQRQLSRAKAPAPAQAAAVRATSLLHSACQGLLEVCSSVDLSRRQDKDGTRESVLSQQAAGTNKRQQDRAERKRIRQQQQAEALQAKARAMERQQQPEQQKRKSEQQQEEQLQYQEQQQPQPQRSRVQQQQQPEPQRQQQPQQQITLKGRQQQQEPPSSRLDQLQLQTSQSSASFAASRTGSASSSCSLFSCSSQNGSAAGDTPATLSSGTDGSAPAGSAAVPAAAGPVVCGLCGLTGHLLEACLTSHCTRCNKWGHTTGKCGSGCSKCGGVGHLTATCAVPRCGRCHCLGHTKTICPRLRVVPSSMAGRAGRPQQEGHTPPAAAAAPPLPPPPPPPPPPVAAAAAAALDAVCTAATVGPVVAQEGDSSSTRQAAPAPAEDRQGRDRAAQKQPQSPPLQLQPQLEQLGPGLQQQRLQGLQELPQQQQQELSQKQQTMWSNQTIAAIDGVAGDSPESAGHVGAGTAFAASSSGVSQQLQLQQQQQAVPVASKHQQRPSSGGGSADEGSDTLVSREQLMKILGQQMKALQEEKTARQAAEEMVDHLLSQMQQLQQQPQQQQQQQSHQVAPDELRQLEAQLEATSAQHRVDIAQLRQQHVRQMQQQTAAQAATHQAELQALRQQLTAQTRQHAAELQAAHREQQRQLAAAAANHQAELEACRVRFQRQLQQVLQQQAANHRAELAAAMQHANMLDQRRAS